MSGTSHLLASLCLLSLCLVSYSCSTGTSQKTAKPDMQPSPSAHSSAPAKDQKPPKVPVGPAQKTPSQPPTENSAPAALPKQLVKTGDYEKAFNEYGAQLRKTPKDQALATEYVNSVKEAKVAADKAYDEEDFSSAGRIYDLLLRYHDHFKSNGQKTGIDKVFLNQRLSACKKSLSMRGFQEYRKGNLNDAIAAWQGLIAIDPANEDIKKAINTATLQQKNLHKK